MEMMNVVNRYGISSKASQIGLSFLNGIILFRKYTMKIGSTILMDYIIGLLFNTI